MAASKGLARMRAELGALDLADISERGLGVNRCRRPQSLTRMVIAQPTVMVPLLGEKRVQLDAAHYHAAPGEMLVLPPGIEIGVDNLPDVNERSFEAVQIVFDHETLNLFERLHANHLDDPNFTARWKVSGSEALFAAIADWVAYSTAYQPDQTQTRHRMAEFLLILAKQGGIGNLMLPQQRVLGARVKHLLGRELTRDWRVAELADSLGHSESTLRRKLRAEGRSFRELLEEARMERGVDLVMATNMPISQIAFQCGYESQSRFAERFRKRFSLSPTELRATR